MGLIRSSLRRLRSGPAVAASLAVFVCVSAFVFALAPRLAQAAADDALRSEIQLARQDVRSFQLVEERRIAAGGSRPFELVEDEGTRLDARFPPAVRSLVEDRSFLVDSARWNVVAQPRPDLTVRFRFQPGAEDRIRIVTGRLPTGATRTAWFEADGSPMPGAAGAAPDSTGTDAAAAGSAWSATVFEAALASSSADALGVAAGATVPLSLDSSDALASGHGGRVAMDVTGVFEVVNGSDPAWFDDTRLERPVLRTVSSEVAFRDVSALLDPAAYAPLLVATPDLPLRYAWRQRVDPARIGSGGLDELLDALRRTHSLYPDVPTGGVRPDATLRSGLLGIIERHVIAWSSADAILEIALLGAAGIASLSLGLGAMFLVGRRRAILETWASRGASRGQLRASVAIEGLAIMVPAAAIGLVVALLLVPAGTAFPSIAAAAAMAGTTTAYLVVSLSPAMEGSPGGRRRGSRTARTTARRRVFEILVLVVAGAGAVILRGRGMHGAEAEGGATRVDPLIVAVPILVVMATGIVTLRLYPILMNVLARLWAAARGFMFLLALRRVTRTGTGGSVLFVLLSAAAVFAFSSATQFHLDTAAELAAWDEVGAPYRIEAQAGTLPHDLDPMRLPGIERAAGAYIGPATVRGRAARVSLVALDADAFEAIVRGTPADPSLPPELLQRPGGIPAASGAAADAAATDPGALAAGTDPVPALVSSALAALPQAPALGEDFEVVVRGGVVRLRVVGVRDSFPSLRGVEQFVLISRPQLPATISSRFQVSTTYFLDAPGSTALSLRVALAAQTPAATLLSRAERTAEIRARPLVHAVRTGTTAAAVIAAAYASFAVVAALVLAALARAIETAQLRALGLSRREIIGTVLVEYIPVVCAALAVGAGAGLGLFGILLPGLGLETVLGVSVAVPLGLDLKWLGLILGSTIFTVALAIALAAAIEQALSPAAAMRQGGE